MSDSENKILARLYFNFEGKKRKKDSWVFLANECKKLAEIYGSNVAAAKKIGITSESFREVLKLLELPLVVKNLLDAKKIRFDATWRIASIKSRKRQIKVANAIIDLNAHDGRDVVRYAKNNTHASIHAYVKKLMKSKAKIKNIQLILVPSDVDNNLSIKIKSKRIKGKSKFINAKIKKRVIKNDINHRSGR